MDDIKILEVLWHEMADANQMDWPSQSKYPRIRVTEAIKRYMECSLFDASNFMQIYFSYLHHIKICDEDQVKSLGKIMINEFNRMIIT